MCDNDLIYGLYAQEETNVILKATYANGSSSTSTIQVAGNALPNNLITGEVVVSTDTSAMAPGWTFVTLANSDSYAHAFDETGTVRWVYSVFGGMGTCSPIDLLQNGNLLSNLSEGSGGNPRYGAQEFNLTGKVYKQYILDAAHHDMMELPSGNLIVLVADVDGKVPNETLVELDRETGLTVRAWDLDSYFSVPVNEDGNRVSDENYGYGSNWFHNNSVAYCEEDNALLLSGRVQDAVIKIDVATGELIWILSNPDSNWTADQQDKLLTPTGDLESFEWQYGQHNIVIMPDGDLLIFDNGSYRGKTAEEVLPPEEGYSRVVRYRINEENMTVEQIWEYGKERGSELLAAYVGGQTYLGENHYLMHFGGVVKSAEGEPVYAFQQHTSTGFTSTHIIEILNDEVIFEYCMEKVGRGGNTYRSVRREAYTSNSEPTMTAGIRLGNLIYRGVATETVLPDATAIAPETAATATDNAIYLAVQNLVSGTDMTMYFVGDTVYKTPVTIKNNSFQMIGGEVPVGEYELYYEVDGVLYDLDLVWTNDTTSKQIPTRYKITTTTSDEVMGLTLGDGLYFENTALTVIAMPNEGYIFQGWKQGDTIVSREMNYSFIPTADIALTAVFIPEGTWNSNFIDVVYGDWFYSEVEAAIEAGLFVGTSDITFSPNMKMTAEMVDIVLERMSDGVFKMDKTMLNTMGIQMGDNVSREMLATMLYSYAQQMGLDVTIGDTNLNYVDADAISTWAKTAMTWCVDNGIIIGKSETTLNPSDITTRAEVATVMMRLNALV